MADGKDEIRFDTAEKYSYAYVDDKFAKIATVAAGSAKLVDPLVWSYAETHSYVKVDPSSLDIAVPSGVEELYAKVIYMPGDGGSSGGSASGGISINDVRNYLNNNHYVTSSNVDSAISRISIPTKVSDLANDKAFITSGYVKNQIDSISIPVKISDLANDADFITSGYVQEQLDNILIPAKLSDLVNDMNFVESGYVQDKIDSISVPSKLSDLTNDLNFVESGYVQDKIDNIAIPSKLSDLENDSNFIESGYVQEQLDNISIPTKNSELENDSQYVPLSTVQQMIRDITNSFNHRLAKLEAESASGETNLGDRTEELNVFFGNDRSADENLTISYSNRNQEDSTSDISRNGIIFEDRI